MNNQSSEPRKKPALPEWLRKTLWIIVLIAVVAATFALRDVSRKNNRPKPVPVTPRPVQLEYKTN